MMALNQIEVQKYLKRLNKNWAVIDDKKLRREFLCKDFRGAIDFVRKVADLAEAENHHPDIHIFYNKVMVELWTHAVEGLSEKDFNLVAKIEKL